METKYKCGHIWEDPPELQGLFGEEEMEDECPRCFAKESLRSKIKRLREDVRQMIRNATDIEKGIAPGEVIGVLGEEAARHWYKEAETASRYLADVYDRYWSLLTEEEKSAELKERLKEWAAGNF